MSKLVSINAIPGDGLASLTVRNFGEVYSHQLWSKCKARKPGLCDASGERYQSGDSIYRPLGNSRNRNMRILAAHIERK